MRSEEYRRLIRHISKNVLSKRVPGLKGKAKEEAASEIATAIHARFYGANVDGVESPIWRDNPNFATDMEGRHPTKTAQELLSNGQDTI